MTTPYSQGWVAAHKGKEPEAPASLAVLDGMEWFKGYWDAKDRKIDAKAFLGSEFVESKK